jgi:hypothetical protein
MNTQYSILSIDWFVPNLFDSLKKAWPVDPVRFEPETLIEIIDHIPCMKSGQ